MKWFIYIIILIGFMTGCEEKGTTSVQTDQPSNSQHYIEKTTESTDQVHWVKDLDTAFALSKEQNKPLIVMVESHGCRWCTKMKENTLNNPKVLEKLNEFVIVKVLRENSEDRSRLPEFRHVPIMFFYQPDGELFDNLRGYFEPEDFLEYLDELS
ncbi:MAG: thioredoxin family protein [Campylobacterales bacterium]|nr:thioredoxin family protein [Campylobacterales bacterium]